MIRFTLSDVAQGARYPRLPADTVMRLLLNRPVDALDCMTAELLEEDNCNAFAKAACRAFYGHHPLVIRPDDIWFCIAQGFANHMALHGEQLRPDLVSHTGKKTLRVLCPDYPFADKSRWVELFGDFSRQIAGEIPQFSGFIATAFSTTGPVEQAAFSLCWMDAFSGYFDYEMLAGCGIPEIELQGTEDDWRLIIERFTALEGYGLGHWVASLKPVLEVIARTAAGEVDRTFWESFFRYRSGSGPSELTGWILTLFPYIVDTATDALRPNPYLGDWQVRFQRAGVAALSGDWLMADQAQGPDMQAIPKSLVSAALLINEFTIGKKRNARLVGGLFGVAQRDEDGALYPAFGWAVVEEPAA